MATVNLDAVSTSVQIGFDSRARLASKNQEVTNATRLKEASNVMGLCLCLLRRVGDRSSSLQLKSSGGNCTSRLQLEKARSYCSAHQADGRGPAKRRSFSCLTWCGNHS